MATVNWNDVVNQAEEGPQPVPDGTYNAYVESAEGKMAGTGAPMVVAVFKIADGPYAGRSIFNNFVLTKNNPNAMGFFIQHMGVLGVDRSTITQLSTDEFTAMQQLAQMITGKYATITVSHRVWEGRTFNDVKGLKAYSGTPGAPAPAPAPAAPVPPAAPAAPAPVAPAAGGTVPPPPPPF